MMTNRVLARLMVPGCMLLALVLHAPTSRAAEPLSVIVVMTDDQGYPDLAVHGNPVVRTPNMDALSAQSVRFTDFHVNPFCSPTRAALMTGRMSDRTGVTRTNHQRNYLRRNEVIMPEFFRASGYRTGIFGKWHIGGNYPYRPSDRGFERWIGLGNNGLSTTSDLWNNDRYDDRYWSARATARPTATFLPRATARMPLKALPRATARPTAIKRCGVDAQIVSHPGFCTDVYFDQAMRFIDAARADGKPFFAYIATNVPHWDWNVCPEWIEPYADLESRQRACYYASIERADWNLGRLMAYLAENDLADRTLLVFLTDNGSDVPDKPTSYTAGMRGHKGSLYEGGHRVPCFIRGPRSVVGTPRDVDAFTAHVDLLPTFVDLCGLKMPSREHLTWDGRSLRPLLSGDAQARADAGDWPDRTIVMHVQNHLDEPKKGVNTVVMTSEWRLINGKELYAIRQDRGQRHDVAPEHPDVVKRLRAAYDRHWEELAFDEHPLERPQLAPGGPPLRLSSDLTHTTNFIWQRDVREGTNLERPVWLVEVAQPGTYRFELRRWPREADHARRAGADHARRAGADHARRAGADHPMTAGLPANGDEHLVYCGHQSSLTSVRGKALPIHAAELRLSNGTVLRKEVDADASSAQFDVELPAGPLDIEAWLLDKQGERLTGAYYVDAFAR